MAAGPTITNWFGDLVSHPRVVVEATSVDDIVAILKNPGQYPSPVRAVGSNHSTVALRRRRWRHLIKMSKMNRILDIANDTVTVQAGAIYIDVAKELEKHKLQFYVNTEIGSLSVGSAACCGTKDASMPGEYGQVGSYVTGIKMVLPSGDLLEVTDDQPDLMQKVRSSYGTFGIVYEATFRVRPILPHGGASRDLHARRFRRQTARAEGRRRIADVLHFPLRQPDHGGIPALQPGRHGRPESRHLAAAQLSVGHRRPAVLRAGGDETSPTRPSATG